MQECDVSNTLASKMLSRTKEFFSSLACRAGSVWKILQEILGALAEGGLQKLRLLFGKKKTQKGGSNETSVLEKTHRTLVYQRAPGINETERKSVLHDNMLAKGQDAESAMDPK